MKKSVLLFTILLFTGFIFGQTSKVAVVKIQTSAECGTCKDLLENKLNYIGGIKYAELNLADKTLHVKYSTKKISLGEIRMIISELGYDADKVKALESAVQKLPLCCQPGGMKNK